MLGVEAEGKSITTIEGIAAGRSPASGAAEIPGACRAAMRLLHAGLHRRGQGAARREPEPDGDRGALLAGRQPVPLHRLRQDHPRRDGCRRRNARSSSRDELCWHRSESRRHPSGPSRRRRQGHRSRAVRRRHGDARHAVGQGEALAARARAHRVDRCVEGAEAAGRAARSSPPTISRTSRRRRRSSARGR